MPTTIERFIHRFKAKATPLVERQLKAKRDLKDAQDTPLRMGGARLTRDAKGKEAFHRSLVHFHLVESKGKLATILLKPEHNALLERGRWKDETMIARADRLAWDYCQQALKELRQRLSGASQLDAAFESADAEPLYD